MSPYRVVAMASGPRLPARVTIAPERLTPETRARLTEWLGAAAPAPARFPLRPLVGLVAVVAAGVLLWSVGAGVLYGSASTHAFEVAVIYGVLAGIALRLVG